MTAALAEPGIGHNQPPAHSLREALSEKYRGTNVRTDELLAAVARVPAEINTDVLESRAIEFATD